MRNRKGAIGFASISVMDGTAALGSIEPFVACVGNDSNGSQHAVHEVPI